MLNHQLEAGAFHQTTTRRLLGAHQQAKHLKMRISTEERALDTSIVVVGAVQQHLLLTTAGQWWCRA